MPNKKSKVKVTAKQRSARSKNMAIARKSRWRGGGYGKKKKVVGVPKGVGVMKTISPGGQTSWNVVSGKSAKNTGFGGLTRKSASDMARYYTAKTKKYGGSTTKLNNYYKSKGIAP